jgi:hypothetical protein
LSCQAWEVAVVDATVVQLGGELTEQPGPRATGRRGRDPDLDAAFDDLHRGETRDGGPALLPGSVPAGGRTPLRNRSPTSRRDRPAAPPTGPRRGPSLATACLGIGRARPGHAGPRWLRPLATPGLLFPTLPLPLTLSGSVSGTPAVSHANDTADEPSVTRHHEFRGRRWASMSSAAGVLGWVPRWAWESG